MSCATLIIFSFSVFAQTGFAPAPQGPLPGLGGPSAQQQQPSELEYLMLAVAGSGRRAPGEVAKIDSDIRLFRPILEQLTFDTIEVVSRGSQKVKLGELGTFFVNDRYDVTVSPIEQRPQTIKTKINAKDLKAGKTAILATAELAFDKPVMLRRLDSEEGELIVILAVSPGGESQDPQQNQQQQDSEQEQQEQNEDEQEQEESEPQEEQEEQEEPEDEQQTAQPDEEPKDREEIEALLDMLEAMDKQLQNQEDKRDARRAIGEPWW